MKRSSIITLAIVFTLASVFYGYLYIRGTFKNVEISKQESSVHYIQGIWVEGSFSKTPDEEKFMNFQSKLIDELGQKEVSVFYVLNPKNDNHNQFKAFVGVECEPNSLLLVDSFKIEKFDLKNLLVGTQECSPPYQRVHNQLDKFAKDNKFELKQDSVFERFDENTFYVEMIIKK